MKGKLPQDVPVRGVYNFTLEKAGLAKGKRPVAHWIIDGGKYKGNLVSSRLPIAADDVVGFHKKHRHKLRISAELIPTRVAEVDGRRVPVDDDYNDTNVYITYRLESVDKPTAPSELKVVLKRTDSKFRR